LEKNYSCRLSAFCVFAQPRSRTANLQWWRYVRFYPEAPKIAAPQLLTQRRSVISVAPGHCDLDCAGLSMRDNDVEWSNLALWQPSLEHPDLAARLTKAVGKPIDLISKALPAAASRAIATATAKGLEAALKVDLRTMQRTLHAGSQLLHKALVTASGAAGGAFGLATLPIELPVSTIIMLRSIADIARSEGEDISEPEPALSCVQVIALGGRAGSANPSESGYFAARGMLAKCATEAARFIAQRGVIEGRARVLVRFIAQVASRFGVVVTQKVVAQTLPIVGALGAAVNYAFMEHFQEVARGHFTVRRLERFYGKDVVRTKYERLARQR
jgi:hypothetical protein